MRDKICFFAGLLVSSLVGACGTEIVATGRVFDDAGQGVAGAQIRAEAIWAGGCDGGRCDCYQTGCGETSADGSYEIVLHHKPGVIAERHFESWFLVVGKQGFLANDYERDGDLVIHACDEAGCPQPFSFDCVPHTEDDDGGPCG